MRRSRSRPLVFRLRDAMIAIAAVAVGLAWVHAQWDVIRAFAGHSAPAPTQSGWYLGDRPAYQLIRVSTKLMLLEATGMVCPLMVLILLAARCHGGRSRIWRAQRPGAVACLAATLVLIFELAHQSLCPTAAIHRLCYMPKSPAYRAHVEMMVWRYERLGSPHYRARAADAPGMALVGMSRRAGVVVAGAWLALILAGAWRPQPSRIDRAGRFVGAFWIVSASYFLMLPL